MNSAKEKSDDYSVSTIVYAGKCPSESDVGGCLLVHRAVVEAEFTNEGSNVTGLLMGQGNSVLHLLEGPSYAVLRILRKLSEHEDFSTGKQMGRIIYCVEDRPERVYTDWYSCTLQERKANVEEITPESVNDIVYEVSNSLFEVGKVIKTQQYEDVEMRKHADTLPAKNLVLDLSNSDEFFDLREFVVHYTDPVTQDLESDQVWPVNSRTF